MSMLENTEISTQQAQVTAVVRGSVRMDELTAFYDRAYRTVAEALGRQGLQPSGPAFGYYLSPPGEHIELEAGFPTVGQLTADADVVASELPAGEVARGTHTGSYDPLGESWGALGQWIASQGRTSGQRLWEVYVTEPSPEMDRASLRTDLYWTLAD